MKKLNAFFLMLVIAMSGYVSGKEYNGSTYYDKVAPYDTLAPAIDSTMPVSPVLDVYNYFIMLNVQKQWDLIACGPNSDINAPKTDDGGAMKFVGAKSSDVLGTSNFGRLNRGVLFTYFTDSLLPVEKLMISNARLGKNFTSYDSLHVDLWVPFDAKLQFAIKGPGYTLDTLLLTLDSGWNFLSLPLDTFAMASYLSLDNDSRDVNEDFGKDDVAFDWSQVFGFELSGYWNINGDSSAVNFPFAMTNLYAFGEGALIPIEEGFTSINLNSLPASNRMGFYTTSGSVEVNFYGAQVIGGTESRFKDLDFRPTSERNSLHCYYTDTVMPFEVIRLVANPRFGAKNFSLFERIHMSVWVPEASKISLFFRGSGEALDSLLLTLQAGWNIVDTTIASFTPSLTTFSVDTGKAQRDAIYDYSIWGGINAIILADYTDMSGNRLVQPIAFTDFMAWGERIMPKTVPAVAELDSSLVQAVFCKAYSTNTQSTYPGSLPFTFSNKYEGDTVAGDTVWYVEEIKNNDFIICPYEVGFLKTYHPVNLSAYNCLHLDIWTNSYQQVAIVLTDSMNRAISCSAELNGGSSKAEGGWVKLNLDSVKFVKTATSADGVFRWDSIKSISLKIVSESEPRCPVAITHVYFFKKLPFNFDILKPFPDKPSLDKSLVSDWMTHYYGLGKDEYKYLIEPDRRKEEIWQDLYLVEEGNDTVALACYAAKYDTLQGGVANAFAPYKETYNSPKVVRLDSFAYVGNTYAVNKIHFDIWTPVQGSKIDVSIEGKLKGGSGYESADCAVEFTLNSEGWNRIDADLTWWTDRNPDLSFYPSVTKFRLLNYRNAEGVAIDSALAFANVYFFLDTNTITPPPTYPAPAKPTYAESDVMALYCSAYTTNTKHFVAMNWGGNNWIEHTFAQSANNGGPISIYHTKTFHWDGFGVNSADTSFDFSEYEVLHADIYVTVASHITFTFEDKVKSKFRKSADSVILEANKWNSIDLDVAQIFPEYDFKTLRYVIIEAFHKNADNSSAENTPLGITNLYFRKRNPSGINDIKSFDNANGVVKYVKDGQLIIERNGKKYNAHGVEL